MSTPDEDIVRESAMTKNAKQRTMLKLITLGFFLCLFGGAALGVVSYLTVRSAAVNGTELAQQIKQACEAPGITDPGLAQFCPKADSVVEAAPEQVKSFPVPGPPGADGIDGTDGTDGTDGSDGTDGKAGKNGTDGATGPRGPVGPPGPPGDTGPIGPQGPAGEDGTDGQNGSDGTEGDPGTANVQDNCDPAPEGQKIEDVNYSYDESTQMGTITCTYSEDQTGPIINP